jgi:ubiquinone/menaquinone biosynthesis C-methylase UbiE
MYERELVGPLFRPYVDPLLDGVGLTAGDRVLDLACGTGIVGRVVRERLGDGARVVGVDLSPLMIGHARTVAPAIEFREGSADALPLADGEQFDVVACQQGLQFFADKPKAMTEVRRALAPGGRVAFATWRPIEESPFFVELQRVAEGFAGPISDVRHSFGDAGAIRSLLEAAGYADIRVERHERTIRFADGPTFIRMNAMAILGMSAAGKAMSEAERIETAGRVAEASAEVARRYADGGGVAFVLATNMAFARV